MPLNLMTELNCCHAATSGGWRVAYLVLALVLTAPFLAGVTTAWAGPDEASDAAWIDEFGSIALQDPDGGRTMPLDTYARQLAVELTGRSHWSARRGPAVFADRHPVELLCDLLFKPNELIRQPLIGIENRPLKASLDLDPQRRFFTPIELASNDQLTARINDIQHNRQTDPKFRPTHEDQLVIDVQNAIGTVSVFLEGKLLQVVPNGKLESFLNVGLNSGSTAPEHVQSAFEALGRSYAADSGIEPAVRNFKASLAASGTVDSAVAKRVALEVMYNHHRPWLWTAVLYGMSIVFFGLSGIFFRKPMSILATILLVAGVAEQCLGLTLRVMILDRPPVSNTYEAILWMGLVAIAVAAVAQILNHGGWYLVAGVIAAELCVIFSMLVPLADQTNSIPPVLRSNYWLIVHVLTIVASYGVFGLSAILGHVYLFRSVLFARKEDGLKPMGNPIIAQVYRTMQVGVFLLTVGTILGGVWAADSWGRFWGWDPKETWALISIVIYVALIHARFVGWLKDFGLAFVSILGFLSIVWTFYGVNYVMASGLHSYGFGSGGERWVGLWAVAELVLLTIARIRHRLLIRATREARKAELRSDDRSPVRKGLLPQVG